MVEILAGRIPRLFEGGQKQPTFPISLPGADPESGNTPVKPEEGKEGQIEGQDQQQDKDEQEPEEDELEDFRPLLSHLRLEKLPKLAISLKTALVGDDPTKPLTCTVIPQPLSGAYNILFRVIFSDNTTWIFKIPGTGYLPEWSEASRRKLQSEANTMHLIRKQTTIPVPEVFAFDSGVENVINAPYIAMDFINGVTMYKKWYGTGDGDEGLNKEQLEERRVKWLKRLAEFSFELGKFTFDKCGMLGFREDGFGEPTSIGPLSVADMEADNPGPEGSDEPVTPKFREIGPFPDTKSYLLGLFDLHSCGSHSLRRILRQLINWIPDSIADAHLGPSEHCFVLCHPDFGLQNIIISDDDDDRILGIIDWDGVATSPLCLGNERYPHWLTRDWDPMMYEYDPENPENNQLENSPEELQLYREIYATHMQSLVGSERQAFTKYSHIYEALEIAAGNMYAFGAIVNLLCKKCIEASRPEGLEEENDEVLVYDVIEAFEKEPPAREVMNRLREGFLKLCGQVV